ncbi:hypothetical protein MACH10_11080 [Thalassospira tepidiphila]|uniref:hypothetical protein n=1 Tax=Thalassospira tepidiphila TaxID=393657 RepID=UPI00291E218A|nr:hypothetical protein MACH10_11080 [Thalassospira tepidiphila]
MESYGKGDIFTRRIAIKTLNAWEPYTDCVSILFSFQYLDVADGEDELPEWRIFWVAGLTLLRTIGHVLDKVDKPVSSKHADVIGRNWMRIKTDRQQNRIFWDFVEDGRNNLLKTYSWGTSLVKDEHGYFVEYKSGDDAFQLFREAVYWWRYQLEKIESEIAE